MEHFLSANGIDSNERKRAVFLSIIGPRIYKLLCSLVAPAKPGEKDFAELVAALTQRFAPKPSEIVQRYKFHTRFRRQGESVASEIVQRYKFHTCFRRQGESVAVFVAELRALAQTCNFGDTFHAQRSSGVRDGRRFHSATVTRRAKSDLQESARVGAGFGDGS